MDHKILEQLAGQYLPAIFAFLYFAVVAIILFFKPTWIYSLLSKKKSIDPSDGVKQGVKLARVAVLLILISISTVFFVGGTPWEEIRLLKSIFSISSNEISSIDIISWGMNSTRPIPKIPLIVKDKNRINDFCNCLNNAQSWNLGHIKTEWECKIKIHSTNATYTFLVDTDNKIALIYVFDKDNEGLTIGDPIATFSSDSLGKLISSWARENEK